MRVFIASEESAVVIEMSTGQVIILDGVAVLKDKLSILQAITAERKARGAK